MSMSTANNCVDYIGHFLRGSILGCDCGVAVACCALMLVVPVERSRLFDRQILLWVGLYLQEGRIIPFGNTVDNRKKRRSRCRRGEKICPSCSTTKNRFSSLAFAIELSRYNPLDEWKIPESVIRR